MREVEKDGLNEYEEGDDEEVEAINGECLVVFAKKTMFARLKIVHTLPTDKLGSLKRAIEKLFQCISEMPLSDFCLKLWVTLIELSDDLKDELANSIDLSNALNELLHVARYMTKGGDSRGMIQ
jgi:hypothetical protein